MASQALPNRYCAQSAWLCMYAAAVLLLRPGRMLQACALSLHRLYYSARKHVELW